MMHSVLHDEAHDAVWRVCAKEQVLAHPHRPSPPLAWLSIHHIQNCFARKNGRQAATKIFLHRLPSNNRHPLSTYILADVLEWTVVADMFIGILAVGAGNKWIVLIEYLVDE